jgi:N-acetylglutamate synthase-like GNAT family acetyltransferase
MKIIDLIETPDSLELLAQWHQAEWEHLNPGKTLEDRREKMQEYLEGKEVPRTFVCKDGETVMGSAAIIESDMETRPELSPWMASVYVHDDFRGKGIGSALVKRIMEYARSIGVETLYLYTEHQEAWYQKLGWEVFAREEYLNQMVTIMKTTFKARNHDVTH